MVNLERIIRERIEKLEVQIKSAATERDESATPTESAHDQTRQIANQLFNSLLEEKQVLVQLIPKIKKYTMVYKITKKDSVATTNYMIVPDGLGGMMVEDTLLVGESSPIGMILKTKSGGEEFMFNQSKYLVGEVMENK